MVDKFIFIKLYDDINYLLAKIKTNIMNIYYYNNNILYTLVIIPMIYMLLYIYFNNKEHFINFNPGKYPLSFNIEDPTICKKKELCRPIYNCRRIGYFCSAIN